MWVVVLPFRKSIKIEAIFNAKDERLFYAAAGENVKVFLLRRLTSCS